MEAIDSLWIHPKFMGQLNKIFNNETVDLKSRFEDEPLLVILKTMDELVLGTETK
jgi:hypothetical protein